MVSVGDSRLVNNAAAARPTLANAARTPGDVNVDAAAGHDRLGETESPLQFTLFPGVQIVSELWRHDHVDADQPV